MKITVATVCYNAEDVIEDTMKSVLNQTYQDIEYLIIDGKSTDRTMEIVNKYLDDSRVIAISEPDSGIYNAMNKAIKFCTGEYIIYMNAGDCFKDERVVEDVIPELRYDIVYGDVLRKKKNKYVMEKYSSKDNVIFMLLAGMVMSHQAMFTYSPIMQQYGFDEEYMIRADYDFVVRAKRNKVSMHHIDRVVSIVESVDGISSRYDNYNSMRKETDRSLKKNFPFFYCCVKLPIEMVRFVRRRYEKKCMRYL